MSTTWKQSIKTFLANGSEKELKTSLRKEWIDTYPEDKTEIYKFLFLDKQFKLLTNLFAIDLQSQVLEVPWILFLNTLLLNKVSIPDDLFSELSKNLRTQKMINTKPTTPSELLNDLKSKERYFFLQTMMKAKQELISSARIALSEQLADQHVHYMNELRKIAPNEYNVSSLISDQEKKKAERILDRFTKRTPTEKTNSSELPSDEEKQFVEQIARQARDFLKQNKAQASDFAYLFRSLNENKLAVDFANLSQDVSKKDWQLLDYLFVGKQYLSLLDHCLELKKKHSESPDSLFSISYAEASAYWELGEKEKARHLMGQIAAMRPDFKSATETLRQWKEDSFE